MITNELSALTRPETGQIFSAADPYLEQTALVYLPKADDSCTALAAEVSYIWLPDDQNSGVFLILFMNIENLNSLHFMTVNLFV